MRRALTISDYVCRNCGADLTGEFCANCGQEDKEVRRPFLYFLREMLRVTLDLDGRAYRTIYYLMVRPGFLTREFFSGRRVAYTPPLRLFLIISIGFFLMIGIVTSTQSLRQSLTESGPESAANMSTAASDDSAAGDVAATTAAGSVEENVADGSPGAAPQAPTLDSAEDVLENLPRAILNGQEQALGNVGLPAITPSDIGFGLQIDLENGEDDDLSEDELEDIREITSSISLPFLSAERNANLSRVLTEQVEANIQEVQNDPVDFLLGSLEYVTFFMLLMMPLLALIQRILFVFCKNYYVEHLVLTLHNHTFIIFSFFLIYAANAIEGAAVPYLSALFGWIGIGLSVWMIVYLFLSLKTYFGRGYLLTGALYLTSTVIYGAVLGMGISVFALFFFIFA